MNNKKKRKKKIQKKKKNQKNKKNQMNKKIIKINKMKKRKISNFQHNKFKNHFKVIKDLILYLEERNILIKINNKTKTKHQN